jgi:hypothetical protein
VIPEADAASVCAMERALDVYARPYDPARPVVGLDEKRKQLVRQTREPFTDSRGVRYEDYEYDRAGVGVLYSACEPLAGWREVSVEAGQDRLTWARVVGRLVEGVYAGAERVTLVQDNLSAHTEAALYEVYEPDRARSILRRLEVVPTPVHGSWLNVAEVELSVLARQALGRWIGSREELEVAVRAWSSARTAQQKGVSWQFTTEEARVKLARLYPTVIA